MELLLLIPIFLVGKLFYSFIKSSIINKDEELRIEKRKAKIDKLYNSVRIGDILEHGLFGRIKVEDVFDTYIRCSRTNRYYYKAITKEDFKYYNIKVIRKGTRYLKRIEHGL